MLCFCCLRWQNNHVAWDEITETGNEHQRIQNMQHNKHQHYMATVYKCLTFPPFLCRIYTSVPAAPFGPSWALWDRETATIIDLWPHIKPRMTSLFDTILHDWSALIRSSAWPSLTGSETSDSCSSLWKRWDSREIRTGSDWNPAEKLGSPWMDLWKATADFW